MKRVTFIGIIAVLILATCLSLSYWFGGLLGLLICLAVFALIAIEVVYHFGAKGSLLRSFRSNASSDVPDTNLGGIIQGPRGWYDLDNRGRGRN